jgi:LCP family protein required for cell wall assembly
VSGLLTSSLVKNAGRVLAAFVSLILITGTGYYWSTYRRASNALPHILLPVGRQPPTKPGAKPLPDIDGKDQNILIVGNDDRTDMTNAEVKELHTGRDGGSEATDTMMIVHIPADGSKATLISLPRDSYVAIPGHGMNRLNAAYAEAYSESSGNHLAKEQAGAGLLIKTVENLTGLTMDHYVQVDLIGFYRISKAIGGVPINLCQAVDDTHAHNVAEGQDGGSGFHMSAGRHTISGVTALEFVRQRHNLPLGDLNRVERQRYFLTAAFRKVQSAGILLNPSKLNALIDAVDKSIYVDEGFNLTTLAEQLSNLSANNIVGKTIPIAGDDSNSPVGDVLEVNPAQVKTFVRKIIGKVDPKMNTAKAVSPKTVTVSVLNGGTVNGAAAGNARTLRAAGFRTSAANSNSRAASTTIEYADGMQSQARTLALFVPGALLVEDHVSTLTLVLGRDGLSAKAHPTKAAHAKKTTKAIDSHCIY